MNEWSQTQTDLLCDIIADGGSFGAAAKAIGKKKGAVHSKWKKIERAMGAQAHA